MLAQGDYIQIDDHLAMVTKDLNSGGTVIEFEPPIVHDAENGTVVDVKSPSVIMRMIDDSQVNFAKANYSHNEPISFEAVQAL